MVIHLIIRNVIDLRVLGDEFCIEGVDGRMCLHTGRITTAKCDVKYPSIRIR